MNKILNRQNILFWIFVVWIAFITSSFSTYVMQKYILGLFKYYNGIKGLIHVGLCIPSFSILERVFDGIYQVKPNKIYLGISEFIFSLLVIIRIFILGYNI